MSKKDYNYLICAVNLLIREIKELDLSDQEFVDYVLKPLGIQLETGDNDLELIHATLRDHRRLLDNIQQDSVKEYIALKDCQRELDLIRRELEHPAYQYIKESHADIAQLKDAIVGNNNVKFEDVLDVFSLDDVQPVKKKSVISSPLTVLSTKKKN